MAKLVRYRLIPRGPFHVGERGVGIEEASVVLHSDTIFSALIVALRELRNDPAALLERWPRVYMSDASPRVHSGEVPPPFLVSSAFPYAGDVFFLPRPLLPLVGLSEQATTGISKRLKKLRFVSERVFAAIVAAQPLPDMTAQAMLQDGIVLATPDEARRVRQQTGSRLWAHDTAPHVAIDRVSSAAQVYGVGRVTFADGCGLALLIAYSDPSLRGGVERALRLLGDAGLGGERSSGCGQFVVQEAGDFQTPEAPGANGHTLLSLYWPTRAEVEEGVLDGASYSLISRRGWIGSPDGMNLRRRTVRMLAEGSVVRRAPTGALADVRPLDPAPAANTPHDVWRCGLALAAPCRCQETEEAIP